MVAMPQHQQRASVITHSLRSTSFACDERKAEQRVRVGAERTKACNAKGDKWLSGFEPFHHLRHSDGGVLALVLELEEKAERCEEKSLLVKKR